MAKIINKNDDPLSLLFTDLICDFRGFYLSYHILKDKPEQENLYSFDCLYFKSFMLRTFFTIPLIQLFKFTELYCFTKQEINEMKKLNKLDISQKRALLYANFLVRILEDKQIKNHRNYYLVHPKNGKTKKIISYDEKVKGYLTTILCIVKSINDFLDETKKSLSYTGIIYQIKEKDITDMDKNMPAYLEKFVEIIGRKHQSIASVVNCIQSIIQLDPERFNSKYSEIAT